MLHGSRAAEYPAEIENWKQQLKPDLPDCHIYSAFLEILKPSLPESITQCVSVGIDHITIIPLFVTPGTHIREHIPALLAQSKQEHPEVKIELLPYLGALPGFLTLISKAAQTGLKELSE